MALLAAIPERTPAAKFPVAAVMVPVTAAIPAAATVAAVPDQLSASDHAALRAKGVKHGRSLSRQSEQRAGSHGYSK